MTFSPTTTSCCNTEVMMLQDILDKSVSSQCFLVCLFIEIPIYMIAVPVTQVAEGFLENTGIQESTEGSMTSKQLTPNLPKIHSRKFRE